MAKKKVTKKVTAKKKAVTKKKTAVKAKPKKVVKKKVVAKRSSATVQSTPKKASKGRASSVPKKVIAKTKAVIKKLEACPVNKDIKVSIEEDDQFDFTGQTHSFDPVEAEDGEDLSDIF